MSRMIDPGMVVLDPTPVGMGLPGLDSDRVPACASERAGMRLEEADKIVGSDEVVVESVVHDGAKQGGGGRVSRTSSGTDAAGKVATW